MSADPESIVGGACVRRAYLGSISCIIEVGCGTWFNLLSYGSRKWDERELSWWLEFVWCGKNGTLDLLWDVGWSE